ncbi:MAG: thrombospondin type 3 repeat-containing protein [Acidobacteriota bacterium]
MKNWRSPARALLLSTLACLGHALLVGHAVAAVYVVDSIGDGSDADLRDPACDDGSGACTLRAALEQASDRPGPDLVQFDLEPATGFIIRPLSELPTVDDPVTIDGRSQPGYAGVPIIELDGSLATGFPHGLRITGGDVLVDALSIHSFVSSSIRLSSRGRNTVRSCFIGARPDGTTPGSGLNGVYVFESPDNRITDNVVAASRSHGVHVSGAGSRDNVIQGNLIGLAPDGVTPAGNGLRGISIAGAPGAIIGGTAPGQGNVAMASGTEGIAIVGSSAVGAVVEGNSIGGGDALRNFVGLLLNDASNSRIGGGGLGAGNTISGNFIGLRLTGTAANNLVEGNEIGVLEDGVTPLANETVGAWVDSTGTGNRLVGNHVAHNVSHGMDVRQGLGTVLSRNSIHDNGGLGIDLGNDGVPTLNDPLDLDDGANGLLNHPLVNLAEADCFTTRIAGWYSGPPSVNVEVELFGVGAPDPSGHGEGDRFVGAVSVTTDGAGNTPFDVVVPERLAPGTRVVATATTASAGTSEFSTVLSVVDICIVVDRDFDGIPDHEDNCADTPNAGQEDADTDGVGTACDNCPADANAAQLDGDGDGWGDVCDNCPARTNPAQADDDADAVGDDCDNCPATSNTAQEDGDADTVGDACDNCPEDPNSSQADGDADAVGDDCDNCPVTSNLAQEDGDADTVGDACDNCPADANPSQADGDVDAVGDDCDNCPEDANTGQGDSDADAVGDVCDNCPTTSNVAQGDGDTDAVGDACDNCPEDVNPGQDDGDADAIGDACDNCPTTSNVTQEDGDADAVGDACDNCPEDANPGQDDDDADAIGDDCDNCPATPNVAQENSDADAVGDACDNCPEDANPDQEDGDADAIGDECDNCPEHENPAQEDADADIVGDACDNCPDVANTSQVDSDGNGMGDACEACGRLAGVATVTPSYTCPGETATLDASSIVFASCPGSLTFEWRDELGVIGWSAEEVVAPMDTTTYELTVTCDADPSCTSEAALTIEVDRPPELEEARATDVADCNLLLELTWTAATFFDATASGVYHVHRSEVSCDDALLRPPVGTVTGQRWLDLETSAGVTYHYAVVAEDSRTSVLCSDPGPENGGATTAVCLDAVVDAAADWLNLPAPIGPDLRMSHDDGEVTARWPTARPLLLGERYVLLKADLAANGMFVLIDGGTLDSARLGTGSDVRLQYFDLRVEGPCSQLSP